MYRQLERVLWEALETRPLQRLRRVKQLGFSDLVFPGATHSRLMHSMGVFHTARNLMRIVRQYSGYRDERKEDCALAASLLHDLGHGPFSHAFEEVRTRLGFESTNHEDNSVRLIQETDLAEGLRQMGSGFPTDVADMVKGLAPPTRTVHNAIVSSQFDADRLDYMQRDRLMTGTQHSAIDFAWLLANLEVADVPTGVDDTETGTIPTFVIGPKAIQAAEAYVLGLFQLYPTVYFHKTTRGAERLFEELLARLFYLTLNGSTRSMGLPDNHPLIRYATHADDLEAGLRLDDAVVWGALSLMGDANDALISAFSTRLRDRKLYKCFDVRASVAHRIDPRNQGGPDAEEEIDRRCEVARTAILGRREPDNDEVPRLLVDEGERSPYGRSHTWQDPTGQIKIRTEGGTLVDLAERSNVVASLRRFKFLRVYYAEGDHDALETVKSLVYEEDTV